jgi:hypothetical protein
VGWRATYLEGSARRLLFVTADGGGIEGDQTSSAIENAHGAPALVDFDAGGLAARRVAAIVRLGTF